MTKQYCKNCVYFDLINQPEHHSGWGHCLHPRAAPFQTDMMGTWGDNRCGYSPSIYKAKEVEP
jgi:hypothetical protein